MPSGSAKSVSESTEATRHPAPGAGGARRARRRRRRRAHQEVGGLVHLDDARALQQSRHARRAQRCAPRLRREAGGRGRLPGQRRAPRPRALEPAAAAAPAAVAAAPAAAAAAAAPMAGHDTAGAGAAASSHGVMAVPQWRLLRRDLDEARRGELALRVEVEHACPPRREEDECGGEWGEWRGAAVGDKGKKRRRQTAQADGAGRRRSGTRPRPLKDAAERQHRIRRHPSAHGLLFTPPPPPCGKKGACLRRPHRRSPVPSPSPPKDTGRPAAAAIMRQSCVLPAPAGPTT